MQNNNQQNFDWKRYLIVFFITLGIFLTAVYLSNYFSNRKLNQLKSMQDKISIDILSSETQFSLLSEMSCKNVSDSALSGELADLGQKIEWGQANIGTTDELVYLKKYYSLLQIKDYLLMKKITARCGKKAAFVLYFYTTAQNCSDCEKESLVLSTLREKYPELRVYSFDYSTDLSAVKAMINIYKIKDTALPALVIDDNLRTGFQPIESVEKIIKASFKLQEAKPETTKK
jgi:thiol-disulfide isomerase/thioredoxin